MKPKITLTHISPDGADVEEYAGRVVEVQAGDILSFSYLASGPSSDAVPQRVDLDAGTLSVPQSGENET